MIKAIETRYAGCRFRSRLEARWAVFFDALNIEWEYEPEGFETSEGWYLPDFRISMSNVTRWFEVKPPAAKSDPRHAAFARHEPLVVSYGMPSSYGDQLLRDWLLYYRSSKSSWVRYRFISKGNHGAIVPVDSGALTPLVAQWDRYTGLVDQAFIRARSARFEFGESG